MLHCVAHIPCFFFVALYLKPIGGTFRHTPHLFGLREPSCDQGCGPTRTLNNRIALPGDFQLFLVGWLVPILEPVPSAITWV